MDTKADAKTDTKQKIMQCAEELFYLQGYDAAGVQEIVTRAGITKPTLYYYFGSKRGLLDALLETKFALLRESVSPLLASDAGIREKLYQAAGLVFDFFGREHDFYILFMSLCYAAKQSEAYDAVLPYKREVFDCTVKMFVDRANELGNMNGRQEQFALSFIGVLNQYLMWVSEGNEGSLPQLEKLVNQFMHGIFS